MNTIKKAILLALIGVLFPRPVLADFQFTAVGDYGNSSNTNTVLDGIAASGSNFNLALGDLSYGYISEVSWCNYVMSHVGSNFPFELLVGNHDTITKDPEHSDINILASCLPDHLGGLTGEYPLQYYFDYQGLARIIQISPNIEVNGQTLTYALGSSRYNWLASAIDNAHSSNIPWIIVSMHELCLTIGNKTCEIGSDLLNLLVNKKVDLVIQAHDHNYQRSKQLALGPSCPLLIPNQFSSGCVIGDGTPGSYIAKNGTVFTIVGSGGNGLNNVSVLDPEAGYFFKWMGANVSPRYGFLKVNVTSDSLFANFVGTTSTSSFTDSFTIQPPSSDAFTGEYYSNQTLSGAPTLTRNDPDVNFTWGTNSPHPSLPVDLFSARWTKTESFASGTYRFSVTADDGVRLKVDGVTVIDKWLNQPPTTYTADVPLTAGNHTVVMEYYENAWDAVAKLTWSL